MLTELVEFMFSNQFAMARSTAGTQLPPVYVYAVETAIQMTLTELNENLREIYIEAYTQQAASDYIFRETAKELYQIFGRYQPELTERDFYAMEIGSSGIMRGYMAHPCDEELTLEKKLRMFLTMSLRAYHVPEDEIEKTIGFIEGLNIREISERVMQELFKALAMHFEWYHGSGEIVVEKDVRPCTDEVPCTAPWTGLSHGVREGREMKARKI